MCSDSDPSYRHRRFLGEEDENLRVFYEESFFSSEEYAERVQSALKKVRSVRREQLRNFSLPK